MRTLTQLRARELAVSVGIALWAALFAVVAIFPAESPVPEYVALTAWVALPVAVGVAVLSDAECDKQTAVIYTLSSAVPLLGIIPASMYLGSLANQ